MVVLGLLPPQKLEEEPHQELQELGRDSGRESHHPLTPLEAVQLATAMEVDDLLGQLEVGLLKGVVHLPQLQKHRKPLEAVKLLTEAVDVLAGSKLAELNDLEGEVLEGVDAHQLCTNDGLILQLLTCVSEEAMLGDLNI